MLIKVYGFNEAIKIGNIKEVISKNLYNNKPIVNNANIIGIVDTKKTYICNDGLYVNAKIYDITKEDFKMKELHMVVCIQIQEKELYKYLM